MTSSQVDEVHRVKDPRSQLAIAFRQFKSQVRFGLTGTAVQNDLASVSPLFAPVRRPADNVVPQRDAHDPGLGQTGSRRDE